MTEWLCHKFAVEKGTRMYLNKQKESSNAAG